MLASKPAAAGRGVPLWLYTTSLVLVPMLGVGALAVAGVKSGWMESVSAARAEQSVKAVSQLDAVRSAVDREVIPVVSLTLLRGPTSPVAENTSDLIDQTLVTLHEAERNTDRALARVPDGSPSASALRGPISHLKAVRAQAEVKEPTWIELQATYSGYGHVTAELTEVQRRALRRASAQNVSAATLRAVQDVQLISQLNQSASREVPLFIAARVPNSLRADERPFDAVHRTYKLSQVPMEGMSQPSLERAWHQLRRSYSVTATDTILDVDNTALLSNHELADLLTVSAARQRDLGALLYQAVAKARSSAAADRQAADAARNQALGIALIVLVASGAAALLVGRLTMRGLGLLAGQAQQISEGVLTDVGISGPREVRAVSAALASAVGSLRRIQGQARAVAEGDLSNALLEESLPGPLGELVHASVQQIVTSVRQREELQSALAHQAAHDPLTDLANRAQALRLTASALHRAQRSGKMTGLLFIDLDGFKAVNDGFGHASGDQVLREVSRRLQANVRSGDVVCRLGGDEFVVLVEPVESERGLVELAERLIAAVSLPIATQTATGPHDLEVGASVGIAISQDASVSSDGLFAQADAALYRAKAHGRGRAELFDESLRAALASRAELEEAIVAGLENGEMHLNYQPVMNLATGELHSYEALIRWQRPGHGRVNPDDFIPVAEQSRLICDLDRWVLHEATRQLQEWRAQSPAAPGQVEPTIAVNISGRHLGDARVITDVTDALEASGLPAHLLVLEVTETVIVDDPSAVAHLTALRALGVSTAIDDFGTGYTSIGQLGHMPMDILKIDRSFVASDDPAHRSLVSLMIQAAHTFGLTVVAEGVEEHTQLDQLRADSCDHVQGYLLARPLAPEDAQKFMNPRPAPRPPRRSSLSTPTA